MRSRELERVSDRLWRMVALARHRLLMVDYDGTLAPFTIARDQARPPERSLALLRRVADTAHTTVAIVSGRPVEEVEALIGPLDATFIGEHGWERRTPDGDLVRSPLERSVAATIAYAEQLAHESGWGDLLERKRASVVLHTRALPDIRARELQDRCHEVWGRLAGADQVVLDRIDGGIELRAGVRSKATVVLSLMSQCPAGTLAVFIGDDLTDEDAFDAVQEWGFGVKVGDFGVPSLAQARLASSDAIPAFLEEWLRVAESRAWRNS
jgi:trehalose 6-phosphate phosphatase